MKRYVDLNGVHHFWESIVKYFVAKESGKGLSSNDFTTDYKTKLDGIEKNANKTVTDTALSSTSTNPVQNKVICSELDGYVKTDGTSTMTGSLNSKSTNIFTNTVNGYTIWARNDGSYFHFLVSEKDGTTWTTRRPFVLDLKTGVLNINGSASTLKTPRKINNVAFDGSEDITIPVVNPDAVTVYVNSSTGDDTNDGLTASTPVKSLNNVLTDSRFMNYSRISIQLAGTAVHTITSKSLTKKSIVFNNKESTAATIRIDSGSLSFVNCDILFLGNTGTITFINYGTAQNMISSNSKINLNNCTLQNAHTDKTDYLLYGARASEFILTSVKFIGAKTSSVYIKENSKATLLNCYTESGVYSPVNVNSGCTCDIFMTSSTLNCVGAEDMSGNNSAIIRYNGYPYTRKYIALTEKTIKSTDTALTYSNDLGHAFNGYTSSINGYNSIFIKLYIPKIDLTLTQMKSLKSNITLTIKGYDYTKTLRTVEIPLDAIAPSASENKDSTYGIFVCKPDSTTSAYPNGYPYDTSAELEVSIDKGFLKVRSRVKFRYYGAPDSDIYSNSTDSCRETTLYPNADSPYTALPMLLKSISAYSLTLTGTGTGLTKYPDGAKLGIYVERKY